MNTQIKLKKTFRDNEYLILCWLPCTEYIIDIYIYFYKKYIFIRIQWKLIENCALFYGVFKITLLPTKYENKLFVIDRILFISNFLY